MKNYLIIAVALSLCGLTHATTVNVLSSATLNGTYAYTDGIGISLTASQSITAAEIDWNNVKLTSSGTGKLYTDLINSTTTGLKSYTDNDSAGDYLTTIFSAANITSMGTATFVSGTALTFSYILNTTQLAALNSYLTSGGGVFNIGFDPDCTYTVGGLSFIYTVGSQKQGSVPDGGTTALLMIVGLAGVEMFRRKFAVGS